MRHILLLSTGIGVDAVNTIEKMVDDYSATHSSGTGTIGHNSRIFNCNNIRNVKFGPFSHVEGAMTLNEGSVNSCEAILFLLVRCYNGTFYCLFRINCNRINLD